MKHAFTLVGLLITLGTSSAQVGSAEIMVGNRYLHYQHSLAKPLKPGSAFGWQHITTLIKRYNTNIEKGGMNDELMNQAYITASVASFLSLKAGLFYTNAGGYQPSMGLEFVARRKDLIIIIAPRADVARNGSYELFALAEFSPQLTKKMRLYSRLQAMSNAGPHDHNRSYQLVRLGIEVQNFQFGVGVTLDEYGTSGVVHCNAGLFIKTML